MELTCNVCGHKWNYSGNKHITQCSKCRGKGIYSPIKTGLPKTQIDDTINNIKNDVMNGKLLKAINTAGVNPFKKKSHIGDAIIDIVKDETVLVALNKYAQDNQKTVKKVIRKAVNFYLKKEGYID